ncbi:myb-like protein X [Chenopodium quinoa]|uniref:myb-like protein X n=1 Tax=Chenopodium quinoa TaxID=63459 RepID=UPI000B794BBB|nr:myb-like protein X [Chenopodium quinoa]
MAQKHLKELLKEDQEPFYLKDYIANKQCLLKNKQQQIQKLQLKKPKKPTSILHKNTCFFSLQDSPDLRKSPKLFDFPPSPIPNAKSPNKVFLHIPTKTATLLLEAAMRIQKQKSKPQKTQQIKNSGFGLFNTMLKKLSLRNRTQKLKSDPKTEVSEADENVITSIVSCSVSSSSSSSCNGRSSSLDLESSISGRSFDEVEEDKDEDFEFTNVLKENNNINKISSNNNGDYYYSPICLSPLSPFRFSLHKSPSPERCSPAKSPVRYKFQGNVNYKHENLTKFQQKEDEEDKEQNSPVSVLDPPFEDDYDGHEDDSYEIECSYAFVRRAQQELFHKLHRFEKLAELDPIELEKRMIEEEEEYQLEHTNEFEEYNHETFTFDEETQAHDFLQDIIRKTGFQDAKKPGIKRLISDLIIEENSEEEASDEQVIKRICNRLESWKEVESNTIDMMVEIDLKREISDWKKSRKEFDEAAVDIEVAIFAVLVDELVEDLA